MNRMGLIVVVGAITTCVGASALVGDTIAQQAYFKASNPSAGDRFGWLAISVSGDTMVVGASYEDSNATGVNGNQANESAIDSGAAYVFVRSGTTWIQQAYLKASNTGPNDRFGYSVAISGDTIVVGALAEDSSATGINGNQTNNSASDSGAAYVFVRNGSNWTQQAYLKASNTAISDNFGTSVAIWGDTVVVGAVGEDSNATGVNGNQNGTGAFSSGAAYVFQRAGSTWSQQAYLKASNPDSMDWFGWSVSVSGNTVVVGAYKEDSASSGAENDQADNSAPDAGAAYVFARNGSLWSPQAYLKASNTDAMDTFGHSVSVSGDTIVVGAFHEDSSAAGVNGDGANNSATDSGAAYVFVRDGAVWTQQAYLKASNSEASDVFGDSVAISGDSIVVGAAWESSSATGVDGNSLDNSSVRSGAAYLFRRAGAIWSQEAYLKASNTEFDDRFGITVALSGQTIAIAALYEDCGLGGVNGNQLDNSTADAGAVYVFAPPEPLPRLLGDLYCDGVIDFLDALHFAQALIDPAGYANTHSSCDMLNGDTNSDGLVNGADIQGFVGLLVP